MDIYKQYSYWSSLNSTAQTSVVSIARVSSNRNRRRNVAFVTPSSPPVTSLPTPVLAALAITLPPLELPLERPGSVYPWRFQRIGTGHIVLTTKTSLLQHWPQSLRRGEARQGRRGDNHYLVSFGRGKSPTIGYVRSVHSEWHFTNTSYGSPNQTWNLPRRIGRQVATSSGVHLHHHVKPVSQHPILQALLVG